MFKGSIVALVTPMDEKGKLCKNSLKKIINYHIQSKTKAIVSVGTTGESATLSKKEHINVVMNTLEIADGRIPIIAGSGSNSTLESIKLTKKFENRGISACLSITPYYNRPTQEGLYQHFQAISENTSLPLILYNVPIRTGCDLLPKTIIRLSNFKNIIGLKDATGDLSRVNKIKNYIRKKFYIMSGDDLTALDFIRLGGHGVISVTANIAAKEMVKICELALQGNFKKAYKNNEKIKEIHYLLFQEPNPIPIKWASAYLKLISTSTMRLPMTKITEKNKKKLIKAIEKAQITKK